MSFSRLETRFNYAEGEFSTAYSDKPFYKWKDHILADLFLKFRFLWIF